MRKLTRAERGTYEQFITHKGREPSELTVDDCIELAHDLEYWLRGHFVYKPTLKLALGILTIKNGG